MERERVCGCGGACGQGGAVGAEQAGLTRRGVLTGTVAVTAGLVLAGCADDTSGSSGGSTEGTSVPPSGSTDGPSSQPLAGVDDFPVGGGAIVPTDDGPVVVTHPDDDVFLAFSATCPHQGCTVKEVTENTVLCACHGSTFDGSTGDRLEGPAATGLTPVAIRVDGGSIVLD